MPALLLLGAVVLQATVPVTLHWDLDPTHQNATWEVERNGVVSPCGSVQVTPTERRCTASMPTGAATLRLRGTVLEAGKPLVGTWSAPVTVAVGAAGTFTVASHRETKPPPPAAITVTPAAVAWSVLRGQVPPPAVLTVTTSNTASWQTYDQSPFYDASGACAFAPCASGTTTTLAPNASWFKTAAAGTYSHPLTIRSAGLPDRVVPVTAVVK